MKTAIVGYTGFVGSNIVKHHTFDAMYNTKNIVQAYGTEPDLLIYAGIRAEKYLANMFPERDYDSILEAQSIISKIAPKNIVLISTIDIYSKPIEVDENTEVHINNLEAYGKNRYLLERWVKEHYPNATIIRLPALFGDNIKKNFIFDYLNVIPSMLNEKKYEQLIAEDPQIANYYFKQANGFFKVSVKDDEREELKQRFYRLGFWAIHFTDSRSVFQFYNLDRLWADIEFALENKFQLVNLATEPISTREIYRYLCREDFVNELEKEPLTYDMKSIYSSQYGGKNGYICLKEEVLKDIYSFCASKK